MAFAVRGASLLRAPAGAARLTAPRRAAAQPRRALRARAALPSPTQVDGLIGIALCPFALQVASVSLDAALGGGVASVASALAAAASVRSVPVALSVLVGGVLTLERDAIAAKLASPFGGVVRGLAALVAAAVAFGFIFATQVRCAAGAASRAAAAPAALRRASLGAAARNRRQAPLAAATLASKAVAPLLEPSVPLALSALGLALVSLEGGALLKQYGPTVRASGLECVSFPPASHVPRFDALTAPARPPGLLCAA